MFESLRCTGNDGEYAGEVETFFTYEPEDAPWFSGLFSVRPERVYLSCAPQALPVGHPDWYRVRWTA
ncbi:hypothetical protein D3C85_664700 [compost metagenome]